MQTFRSLIFGLALLTFVAGCAGKKRDFHEVEGLRPEQGRTEDALPQDAAANGSSASTPGAEGELEAQLPLDPSRALPPGARCVEASQCDSGTCVDGVCCRTSCDTVCTRCDAPGQEGECSVTPNDPACSVSCPEATECRTYGSSATSANCAAAGLCRAVAECTAQNVVAGTPCEQATGQCDGLGECVVPGKTRLGEPCAGDAECGQGNCVVGGGGSAICCDAGCAGLCRTCGATGRCDQTPRDDARCPSVDCPSDNLCRDYVDDLSVNLCRGFGACRSDVDCGFEELRSGAECACGPDGCELAVGAACTAADECGSGACEATQAGTRVCCALGCSADGAVCASDGSRCVQCEGTSAACQDARLSRRCTMDVASVATCGNGCDDSTGACSELRPSGAGCDLSEQCSSGLCTTDVTGTNRCCDPSCAASGRVCGTDGACVCAANRQDANGACRLVVGEICANGADCATGSCAPTVAGPSVCCANACAGSFCASDGSECVQCEGAGSECAGNVSERCDDNALVRTPCGNGCNAANGVCNGLLGNGQTCNASNQCASNLCAADVTSTNRCCTPNCAASGRVCGTDGACVCASPNEVFIRGECRSVDGQSCGGDGDCRSNACEGTQAGGQVCCSGACNGQICRANGQGCVQCEGGPPSCQGNNSRSCVNNAFVTTTCGNGCNTNTGLCSNLIGLGSTGCSRASQCAASGSSCQNGRCCEFDCAAAGRVCSNNGTCACPENTTLVGGACLLRTGETCDRANQCASGRCNTWFRDADGDLHGDPGQVLRTCGTAASLPPAGYVVSSDDCCDSDALTNPDQNVFQSVANACRSFDYNCDGDAEGFFQAATERFSGIFRAGGSCNRVALADCQPSFTVWSSGTVPPCGTMAGFTSCSVPSFLPNQCGNVNGGVSPNGCR